MRKLFKFSLHKRKFNAETIWDFQGFKSSKKNSFRWNYSRKYGSQNLLIYVRISSPRLIRHPQREPVATDLWVVPKAWFIQSDFSPIPPKSSKLENLSGLVGWQQNGLAVWNQLGKSNWDFAKMIHHSSRMKCDLHTLDLGLQHSGCYWKLLLSIVVAYFAVSG